MSSSEVRGRRSGRLAPVVETLLGERGQAFVAAREVGQDRIDTARVEPAHDLDGEAAQLVGFVEQRGQDEDAPLAAPVEGDRVFLAVRCGPGGDHHLSR